MQKTEQKLYLTPFTPAYWRDAAAQLFNVRILCITAILIALRVAIKSVYIPVGPELNVTFGFFVNALGASIFGPVVAIIAAAITDTLGCIIAPQGTYFFPFIFVEIAGSLVFALFLWRAKMSATRVILSRFFVSVVCNFIMNPLIMIWYYAWLGNGQNYAFITLPRVVKNLALFPFEAFLLVIFMGVMIPILAKLKLIPKEQIKPVLTKGHIVLLAVLLVVAVIIVVMFYSLWMPTQPQSTSTTLSDIKVTLKSDREHYKLADMDPAAPMTVNVTVKNSSDFLWEALDHGLVELALYGEDGTVIAAVLAEDTATSVEAGKSVKITETFAEEIAAAGGLKAGEYRIGVTVTGKLDGDLGAMKAELPIKIK